MGKSSPSTPAPPDPQKLATAQAQANAGTARVQQRLNMVDENTPWYSTTYTALGDRNRNPDGSTRVPAPTSPASSAPPGAAPRQDYYTNDTGGDTGPTTPQPAAAASTSSSSSSSSADPLEGEPAYYNQDRYRRDITLNPEDQKILDQNRRLTQGIGGMAEGQLPRIQGALNQTVDYTGLPANVTGVDTSRLANVNPNFQSGQIQSNLDFSRLPGLQTGGIQTGFDTVGGIQRGVADAGPIQRAVNPQGQWDYNDVGGPDRRLNIQDPTQFTKGVNDTLYQAASSRFEPQIAQEREQLRQSLADRGIPEDSDAAQRELNRFDQQAGDTRLQASASATDRAADQAAKLFGLDLSKFNAENAAQGQAFGQTALQRGDLLNQGLSLGNFANQAQGQQYGQNLSSMQAANQAQGQQFGQNQAAAEFANQAQQQGYGQSLSARQQMANELATQGQFANQAQQQGYGQNLTREQLALQLRQQGLSEQEINAQLAAQARAQGYTERQNVRTQPITDALALLGAQ